MDKVLEKIREQRVRKMYTVDLNCDLGESFGNYKCGMDEKSFSPIFLPPMWHAAFMRRFACNGTYRRACEKLRVHIGAHPGYPDLTGFGRRNMQVSEEEPKAMIQYQIRALKSILRCFWCASSSCATTWSHV